MYKGKFVLVLAIIITLILLLPVSARAASPVLPSCFYGTVLFNEVPVLDGILISAWIDEVKYAESKTFSYESSSVYTFCIMGDDPDTEEKEGGFEADIILFKIETNSADQIGIFHTGTNVELNLTANTTTTPTFNDKDEKNPKIKYSCSNKICKQKK